MPKPPKASHSKKVEALKHKEAKRKNIPTAEYQAVITEEEKSPIRVVYERRNRDLDSLLVGVAVAGFEVLEEEIVSGARRG
jgi:adenine-specific DNA-methyltransferase